MDYKIVGALVVILIIWYRLHKSGLNLAYALSSDGVKLSLSKVLQLIGGLTATYIVLSAGPNISDTLFGLYLAYVGGVEGYSKYVQARYNYRETRDQYGSYRRYEADQGRIDRGSAKAYD